jgi:hypothetical protein
MKNTFKHLISVDIFTSQFFVPPSSIKEPTFGRRGVEGLAILNILVYFFCSTIVMAESDKFNNLTIQNQINASQIIENLDIDESSGLALSRRYDNVLWTHNDSGQASIIYAMDFKGRNLGSYFLDMDYPRDWEDISSFKLDGQSYLILADTGDNFEINMTGILTIYKEPDVYIDKDSSADSSAMTPEWVIEFQYPNRKSYDIESMAVDVSNNKVLLVSKRNKKARVFELPLKADESIFSQVITAKKIAKLDYLKKPSSMDISADGKYAVILTYGKAFWYHKKATKSWKKTLKKPAKLIKFKGLFQPEGISFGKTPYQLFISSETLPARLLKIDF